MLYSIQEANKSLALFVHENVEYSDSNMDCWYYMEERLKPLLDSTSDTMCPNLICSAVEILDEFLEEQKQ